jgi:hypothetical protein
MDTYRGGGAARMVPARLINRIVRNRILGRDDIIDGRILEVFDLKS